MPGMPKRTPGFNFHVPLPPAEPPSARVEHMDIFLIRLIIILTVATIVGGTTYVILTIIELMHRK
jgi:hypothetical protein